MAKPPFRCTFPKIAFVNKATGPLEIDIDKLVASLTKQLDNDFVPIWGYPAALRATQKPTPDEWQVLFLDDADAADALGYHDITANGQPISKVFVRTIKAAGEKVSVTASHEVLEMLIDPGAQLWAQHTNGAYYAYEMCDAVEGEEYEIDGVAVSDFVHPSFFESWHLPNAVQFDHLNKVSRPFQTLQRGYQIVSQGGRVTEIFGSRAKWRHFREVEDRKMHRSEYRKWREYAAKASKCSGGGATGRGSGLGGLDTALRYLRRVPLPDDPLDGWDLPPSRAARRSDDLFSVFDLPPSRDANQPLLGRLPNWPNTDDPFGDGFDIPPSFG